MFKWRSLRGGWIIRMRNSEWHWTTTVTYLFAVPMYPSGTCFGKYVSCFSNWDCRLWLHRLKTWSVSSKSVCSTVLVSLQWSFRPHRLLYLSSMPLQCQANAVWPKFLLACHNTFCPVMLKCYVWRQSSTFWHSRRVLMCSTWLVHDKLMFLVEHALAG